MTPEEIIARAIQVVRLFDWHPCFIEIKAHADLAGAGYLVTDETRPAYRAMITAATKEG